MSIETPNGSGLPNESDDSSILTRPYYPLLRFSLKRYPELELFPAGRERHVVFHKAMRGIWNSWRFRLAYVTSYLVIFGGGWLLGSYSGLDRRVVFLYYLFMATGITLQGHWFLARGIRASLRKMASQRGVPICVSCGYDLRGQIERRCPECGAPF